MKVEIEAKLAVDSLEGVEKKLRQLGAEFVGVEEHCDWYFDDVNCSLRGSDRCVRLRRVNTGEGKKFLLAYKGERLEGRYKKREEVEFEVGNDEGAAGLLEKLGYTKSIVVEKKRKVWRYGGCAVALDEVKDLGKFVEIEGRDERSVEAVQEKLELLSLPHIREGYAVLMFESRKR